MLWHIIKKDIDVKMYEKQLKQIVAFQSEMPILLYFETWLSTILSNIQLLFYE